MQPLILTTCGWQRLRGEREAAVRSLQRQVEEASDGRRCAEHRLQLVESDCRRLKRSEAEASSLGTRCKALQLELHRKTEAFERLLKRRGGAAGSSRPPTPPPAPHGCESLQPNVGERPREEGWVGTTVAHVDGERRAAGVVESQDEAREINSTSTCGIATQADKENKPANQNDLMIDLKGDLKRDLKSDCVAFSSSKPRQPSPLPGGEAAKVRAVSGSKGLSCRESGEISSRVLCDWCVIARIA